MTIPFEHLVGTTAPATLVEPKVAERPPPHRRRTGFLTAATNGWLLPAPSKLVGYGWHTSTQGQNCRDDEPLAPSNADSARLKS
ncbi:hypothetical protein H1V43_22410 [Streptomyces sp. PSKA54]|uniref:Uncharacterized protein n=1 Tax=Streptomyces himalayensis subsp. aureolus TaxID=2758039 RepID=A0A7W2HHS1_9ACTN|nr:hypothetical protein [Streptomyces himalayensis]MBA4864059.1 hypothetical protein [Streptomyces himalayensis subsp. aureolus]